MTRLTDMTDVLSGARRRATRDSDEFAQLVDGGRVRAGSDQSSLAPLVGLARALAPAEHLPEPGFRTALRAQLVAEAAVRVPALPAQRSPERARPTAPRWRSAVAAVAVASAVTGVGATAASSQALPGDSLYGLKLRVESIQLSIADSDLERGRELLEQAETRLDEAERLAAAGSARRDLSRTLTQMDAAATAGAAELIESYQETGDPQPMLLLARFVERQQPRLLTLSVGLDPELRARVLRTIDTLSAVGNAAGAVLSPPASGTGEAVGLPGRARVDGQAVGRSAGLAGRGALPPSAATGPATTSSTTSVGTSLGTSLSSGSDGSGDATAGDSPVAAVPSVPSVTAVPDLPAVPSLTTAPQPQPQLVVPQPSVAEAPAPTVEPLATPVLPCVAVPPAISC